MTWLLSKEGWRVIRLLDAIANLYVWWSTARLTIQYWLNEQQSRDSFLLILRFLTHNGKIMCILRSLSHTIEGMQFSHWRCKWILKQGNVSSLYRAVELFGEPLPSAKNRINVQQTHLCSGQRLLCLTLIWKAVQYQIHWLYLINVMLASSSEWDWNHSSHWSRAVGISVCNLELSGCVLWLDQKTWG